MKKFIWMISIAVIMLAGGAVLAQDLGSNIMRRVNAINVELDKAEDALKRNRPSAFQGYIKGAEKEYATIFKYYPGKADPNHPTLAGLKKRIDALHARARKASEGKAQQPAGGGATQQKAGGTVQAQDLGPNIMRRVNAINVELNKAEDALKRNRPSAFQGYIKGAEKEYATIFKYYPEKADPNHPILAGLKKRIEALHDKLKAYSPSYSPVQQVRNRLDDAAQHMRNLRAGGDTSAKTLDEAKQALVKAEAAFKELTTKYRKQMDTTGGRGSLGAKHSINSARENFNYIKRHSDVTRGAAVKAKQGKISAAVKAIHSRFKQQEVVGKRHAENIGRFIWSKKEIALNAQDQAVLCDTFKLSDPIFGRLYTAHSLGNTPVYQEGFDKPQPNNRFRYVYKLYIDGKDTRERYGVFRDGRHTGKFAEYHTSWQFAPHPVPPDNAFDRESKPWRRITKDLAEGRHSVRFELWGTDAAYRTRKPMAVGEFTLIVGAGERISATGKFPAGSYTGGDLKQIRKQMKKALVGPVTKSADQILDIAVTGNWQYGHHARTKIRYRKIRGAVLWADTDNDKVCRYHTYTFFSDEAGSGWAPLHYRSFGSPEGEVECP